MLYCRKPVVPGIKDKCVISAIWLVSLVFSLLSHQIITNQPCSVREDIQTGFGPASLMIAMVIPVLLGPVSITIIHIIISLVTFLLQDRSLPKPRREDDVNNLLCIFLLTMIFLGSYSSSMIISEIFIPLPQNLLYFIIVKYIVGTSHQLLSPLCILVSRPDIRQSAGLVYRRGGSAQTKLVQPTYEQIQRELGLGVETI